MCPYVRVGAHIYIYIYISKREGLMLVFVARLGTQFYTHLFVASFFQKWCDSPVRHQWFLVVAMEEDVSKTIAFLAAFSDELVSMQKPSLEALLKSSRAKQVKDWNAAKNFGTVNRTSWKYNRNNA